VGDSILDVYVLKIFQALAGEIGAFKAPGYPVLAGTFPETRFALYACWHHLVRVTAIAAHFLNGEVPLPGPLLQLGDVILLLGKVAGARSAVDSADTNQLPVIFLHSGLLL